MKTGIRKEIREALAKQHACYVLITCTEPAEDGHMQVEMTYEGDPTLAAYLLQSAQSFIDDEEEGEFGAHGEKDDSETDTIFADEFRRID